MKDKCKDRKNKDGGLIIIAMDKNIVDALQMMKFMDMEGTTSQVGLSMRETGAAA